MPSRSRKPLLQFLGLFWLMAAFFSQWEATWNLGVSLFFIGVWIVAILVAFFVSDLLERFLLR